MDEKAMSDIQPSLLDKMLYLEEAILTGPQVELPLVHKFADGMYAREMSIPKGTILTGSVHKYDCFFMVTKGDITVVSSDGSGPKRLKAPFICESKAGVKRCGYAHEDTLCMTIHKTDETDPEKLDKLLRDDHYKTPAEVREVLKTMPIRLDALLGLEFKEG